MAGACTQWRTIPEDRAADGRWDHVRVTRRDGSRIELRRAYVRRDSVIGEAGRSRQRQTSLATSDVLRVESLEPHAVRTLLLVAGVFAVVIGLYAWALWESGDCNFPAPPDVSCS